MHKLAILYQQVVSFKNSIIAREAQILHMVVGVDRIVSRVEEPKQGLILHVVDIGAIEVVYLVLDRILTHRQVRSSENSCPISKAFEEIQESKHCLKLS
jgi:hypothetical protein